MSDEKPLITISSGIIAVNACEAITRIRSRPLIRMNRSRQPRTNESASQRAGAPTRSWRCAALSSGLVHSGRGAARQVGRGVERLAHAVDGGALGGSGPGLTSSSATGAASSSMMPIRTTRTMVSTIVNPAVGWSFTT